MNPICVLYVDDSEDLPATHIGGSRTITTASNGHTARAHISERERPDRRFSAVNGQAREASGHAVISPVRDMNQDIGELA